MTLAGLVQQSYPSPEWAVFFEVSNGTGANARRRADAVALGVWPSRGHTLVGFEFKEDRRDWLREKDNPEKAEAVASHCDCWYVVAGTDAIVKLEELPAPWGLLVANKDRTKLLTKKPCEPFPDRDKTTMRRSFVSAMLRKVTETTISKSEVDRLVREAVERALERTREGHELKHLREQVERQRIAFDTFKKITGVDLYHGWQGPAKIAAAVEVVLHLHDRRSSLVRARQDLELAAKDMQKAIDAWPAITLPEPSAEEVA